jgi:microcin C transport system ATP-binding protein
MPLLQVRDLTVRFGAKEVVRGVFEHCAGRKAGAGGRIRLGQDHHRAQPAAPGGRGKNQRARPCCAGAICCSLSEREMRGVRGGDIAMVFQEPMTALNPLMTIGQQIAEVLELKKGSNARPECAQAAIELLAKTGIPEPERRAGQLSAPASAAASASAP